MEAYTLNNGILPLPKSASPIRQKENLDIFGFSLDEDDYYLLKCMVPCNWQHEHPDFVIPGITSR